VACPGLGTGVGKMHHDEAARQMSLAYRHYLKPIKTFHWSFATLRQNAIARGAILASSNAKKVHAGSDEE